MGREKERGYPNATRTPVWVARIFTVDENEETGGEIEKGKKGRASGRWATGLRIKETERLRVKVPIRLGRNTIFGSSQKAEQKERVPVVTLL